MKYICYKRFKDKSLSGNINIPYGSTCECKDNNMIYYNDNMICYNSSENACMHFTQNEDNNGLLRGKLIQNIQKKLSKQDVDYQSRWNKIWEDSICQKYKRSDYSDYWLWNCDFYNANIYDLKYIYNLIDLKGSK